MARLAASLALRAARLVVARPCSVAGAAPSARTPGAQLDLTSSLFSTRLSRRRALRTHYRRTRLNAPSPCAPLEPVEQHARLVPARVGDSKYVPSTRRLPPPTPEAVDQRQSPGHHLFEREAACGLRRTTAAPPRPSAAAAGSCGSARSYAAGLPPLGTASYSHGTFEPAAIKVAREHMQLQGRDVRLSERKERISARSWTPALGLPGAASPRLPRPRPAASAMRPLALVYPSPLAVAASPRPAAAAGPRATAGYCTPQPRPSSVDRRQRLVPCGSCSSRGGSGC